MQHNLEIYAGQAPEVLERVLRVTRHRGFAIESLNMENLHDEQQVRIQLKVSSERSIHLLSTQLSKLVDVTKVTTLASDPQQQNQLAMA